LDSNGYPTTLTLPTPPTGGQLFTQLVLAVFVNVGTGQGVTNVYPADTYRFQWQGKGSITFSKDVKVLTNASAGCTISGLTVTSTNAWGTTNSVILQGTGGTAGSPVPLAPTTAGIEAIIPAGGIPDSANYPKAFTCVQSTYTSQFDGGQIFHPNFLAWMTQFPWKALRFMDALQTNQQVQHAYYTAYKFSSAPTASTPLPALAGAWTNPSGQRRITLATGEELLATFTTGSTVVTSTANPTITATSGTTVPSNESVVDFWWYGYDSWSGRAQLADISYATNRGIPFEILLSLCNTLNCNPWINVPPQFQAADWASLASLVTANMNSGLKCFAELSNEIWNAGAFNIWHLYNCKSLKLWGASDVGSYIGMTISQMADQIATTAGNPGFDNKFIVLMPGQAASSAVLTTSLKAVSWVAQGNTAPWQRTSASGQKTIKAACIAPYIAGGPIYAADFTNMQAQGDGGYSDFFATWTTNPVNGYTYHQNNGTALPSGGWTAIATGWIASTITALAPYGALPIYCYEGGWQFYHTSESPSQQTFLVAAARDSRMANIQQAYFRAMAAAGTTPCQYNFCSPYGGNQWGLIESVMQPETPLSATPARWQGAVNYVRNG
jgi:hypothetical protein